jgi:predicted Zn-dependent protease
VSGGGNSINTGEYDYVWVSQTAGNYDFLNANNNSNIFDTAEGGAAGIYVDADTQLNVTGTGNFISLNYADTLYAFGYGNIIGNAGTGDCVNVCSTGSGGDIVYANGDVGGSLAPYGSGTGVWLNTNCLASVYGDNNFIGLTSGDTMDSFGGGNTISASATDQVTIADTGNNEDLVVASNAIINLGTNVIVQVNGTSDVISETSPADTVYISGADTVDLATGNTLALTASSWADVNGSGGTIASLSSNDGLVVNGSGFSIGDYGSSLAATASNDTFNENPDSDLAVTGNNNTISECGADDVAWVEGTGNVVEMINPGALTNDSPNLTLGAPGSSATAYANYDWVDLWSSNCTATVYGSNNGILISGPNETPILYGSNNQYRYTNWNPNGDGFAESANGPTLNGTNVVAAFDSANGYQQAAASAVEAMNEASQSADGNLVTSVANLPADPVGAIWDSNTITWSFASGADSGPDPFSGAIGAQYQAVIEQALQAWAVAGGINFQEVSDPTSADIQIGWGDFDTATSNQVGYTSMQVANGLLTPGALVQLEDPDETALVTGADGQLTYASTETTLYQAALHEIGHALGFTDNSDPDSVMYYALGASNRTFDATDLAGAQIAYGPGSTVVSQIAQAMASFNATAAAEQNASTQTGAMAPPETASMLASSSVH